MYSLFVSDLHLDAQRPQINTLFIDFLAQIDNKCEALYILGDLFEAWLGDDCITPENLQIMQAIKTTTDRNIPVFIQHGNRDFLLGDDFARQTGCKLLPETLIINLYGTATLIMHGDSLCTDDVEYQKFRQMVRDPQWQQAALAKTPQQRIELAKTLRQMSKTEMATKSEDIMDVNQDTVGKIMCEEGVSRLIHGHTHRPAIHKESCDDMRYTRIVLGDWYEQSSILKCDHTGCRFTDEI